MTWFSVSGNSVAVVHNGRIVAETGKRRYQCPAWIIPWAKSCTTATPHEESHIHHVYIPGFRHHHQHFHTLASPLKLTRSFSASTLQEPHVGGLKKKKKKKKSQLWCGKKNLCIYAWSHWKLRAENPRLLQQVVMATWQYNIITCQRQKLYKQ